MTSEDAWAQIAEAHNKDQWASLLEVCALHLKMNPDHIQAQIPQAIALRHLKRFDEAVALLKKSIPILMRLRNANLSAKRSLGRLCKKWEGLMMRGAHMMKRIVNIGSTYLCERNYEKAIEHYQKAITLDPNYDTAWEGLADAKRALEIREQSK